MLRLLINVSALPKHTQITFTREFLHLDLLGDFTFVGTNHFWISYCGEISVNHKHKKSLLARVPCNFSGKWVWRWNKSFKLLLLILVELWHMKVSETLEWWKNILPLLKSCNSILLYFTYHLSLHSKILHNFPCLCFVSVATQMIPPILSRFS